MSDETDPDVAALLADLTRELRRLQREVEPDRESLRPHRSLRRDLARFTSEVAIPALILVLKTNIQVLELLRRTIQIAEGRETGRARATPEVRDRAAQLGQATLSGLDRVLVDLQAAVEGRPDDERAQQLIEEAQTLRAEIADELDGEPEETAAVAIDVEQELRALKDDLDNGAGDEGTGYGGEETGHDGGDTDEGDDGTPSEDAGH